MDIEELGVRAMALRVFLILAFASFLPADLVLVGDATRVHRADGAQLFLNPCNFLFHFDLGLFSFHSDMLEDIADNVKPANNNFPDANLWMDLLRAKVEDAAMNGANMGDLENLIAESVKELVRPMLRHGAQLVADRQPMSCPDCDSPLRIEEHARERTVNTLFGPVVVSRSYGYCPQCRKRHYPADHALGLQERSAASPRLQEISSLAVLRTPAGRAPDDVRRLTGLDIAPSTLHREARRQGDRALRIRDADVALSETTEGVKALSERASVPKPFSEGGSRLNRCRLLPMGPYGSGTWPTIASGRRPSVSTYGTSRSVYGRLQMICTEAEPRRQGMGTATHIMAEAAQGWCARCDRRSSPDTREP